MRIRVAHWGILILALVVTACAGASKPVAFNFAGPAMPDSEVALIRKVSAGLNTLDGVQIPTRSEEDTSAYYRDIRVTPGTHTLELWSRWGASVLVSPSGYIQGSDYLTTDFEAGHVYELHGDRTHGNGVRLFFWIEDVTADKVVAGKKYGGSGDRALAKLDWTSDAKRIVVFRPTFNLIEDDGLAETSRADWNESGKSFALKHIDGEFVERGIVAIADEGTALQLACAPDTEIGVSAECGMMLREAHQADYGLFLNVKDTYVSERLAKARAIGSVVLIPVLPLILPAMVFRDEGSDPTACMSLINFKTGEVEWRRCINPWTNFSTSWHKEESSKRGVQGLLRSFPKS